MMILLSDIRHAARALTRRSGFAIVATITLGLGIGANTAIFSAVYRMLLAPVPFADAEQLTTIFRTRPQRTMMVSPTPEVMEAWRAQARSFSQLEFHTPVESTLLGAGDAVSLKGARVTEGIAALLRLSPLLGRMFTADEAQQNSQVVVISETLWRTRFGADRGILGKSIRLGAQDRTVIGVMPARFAQFTGPLEQQEYWLPFRRTADDHFGSVIARLRPEVTPAAAARELAAIAATVTPAHDYGVLADWEYAVLRLTELGDAGARRALPILLGAVGLVLLIACANVAGLLLVRLNGRRREIAIRAALGARAHRILSALLVEQALLALAAGGFGLLVALWCMDAIRHFRPDQIALLDTIALDPAVLAFAASLVLISTLLFGMVPAWVVLRQDPINGLRTGGERVTGSSRARSVLVIAQIALSVMLLVGAALLIRTVAALQQRDLGFDPKGVLIVNLSLPEERYAEAARPAFFSSVLEGVRQIPSVRNVALGGGTPPRIGLLITRLTVPDSDVNTADISYVSGTMAGAGFLPALGARVIAGRDFTNDDRGTSRLIVNRAFGDRFWPGQDPVGRRFKLGGGDEWSTIVGVIDNIRADGPLGTPDELQVFYAAEWNYPGYSLVIRTDAADPLSLVPAIRQVVGRVDAEVPIRQVSLLSDDIAASIARERFNMVLLAIFAGLALVLSAVGVYGLIAYTVQQRVPEIGVRIALGAVPATVRDLFLTQGVTLAVAGLSIGLVGAALGAALLRTMVHGIRPYDGVSFGLAVLVIGVMALLASWLPARRAARVDPMVALRSE